MPKIVIIGKNEHWRASIAGVLDRLDHGSFTHNSADDVETGLAKITDETQVVVCDNDAPQGGAVQIARYLERLGGDYPKLIAVSARPGMVPFFDKACADEPYYAGAIASPVRKELFSEILAYALAKPEQPAVSEPATPDPVQQ